MERDDEVWKPCLRDPRYQVSSKGRVLSPSGKILLATPNSNGYPQVTIGRNVLVNVLVCEAFHGPKPFPKACALHRDDVRSNNDMNNVYWGSRQNNMDDRKANNINRGGGVYCNNKLDWDKVREIRKKAAEGEVPFRLASEYNVSDVTIYNIVNNKAWRESLGA